MEEKYKFTILYFLDYAIQFGGAANTLMKQAQLMKNAGHNVIIFFSDYFGKHMSDEYLKKCSHMGIKENWLTYQISNQLEDIDIVCINENYENMRNKIASYKPDILHSVQINACVELVSRELKIPHIMSIYPLIPDFFSINYIDIFPHYHLCDSWYYAHKWQYYLHTDSTCIRNVAIGGSRRKKNDNKEIHFLCVGAVYEEKNQLLVIKAFHKALEHGVNGRLMICGYLEGDYGKSCIQYVQNHALENRIILNGFCTDMNMIYSQNDVLICGSTRESYPNAISEALANGLIVISTSVGGVSEVIVDKENGYLTRDFSDDAIAEKIIQLQEDIINGKIYDVLANAKKTYTENHSPQTVKTQLITYYQYVVNDYKHNQINLDNKNFVNINILRNNFRLLLNIYERNKDYFKNKCRVSEKLWYLYHIKDRISDGLKDNCEIYIWGAGDFGQTVLEIFQVFLPEINIVGFLDEKKKGAFLGYNIYEPDLMIQKENAIIIIAAVIGQKSMIKKLKELNKIYNRNYFLLSKRKW